MDASLEEELRQICYDIAASVQWEHGDPQSTSLDNATPAAMRYFEIAKRHATYNEPRLVIDAVRFLGQAFAIPPTREDDSWLDEGLTVLMYLFEPWDAVQGATREFVVRLRDALQRALERED